MLLFFLFNFNEKIFRPPEILFAPWHFASTTAETLPPNLPSLPLTERYKRCNYFFKFVGKFSRRRKQCGKIENVDQFSSWCIVQPLRKIFLFVRSCCKKKSLFPRVLLRGCPNLQLPSCTSRLFSNKGEKKKIGLQYIIISTALCSTYVAVKDFLLTPYTTQGCCETNIWSRSGIKVVGKKKKIAGLFYFNVHFFQSKSNFIRKYLEFFCVLASALFYNKQ